MSLQRIVVLTAVYNDWQSLHALLPKIDAQLARIPATATVVAVDDGSTDFSARAEVASLHLKNITDVQTVALTRNQGNQRALAVGIGYISHKTDYDHVVVMDADQEDDPRYIPELVTACASANNGSIVFAARTERSESFLFRINYKLFQLVYRLMTGLPISFGNYCIIPRKLLPSVANLPELWNHFAASIMRSRLPRTAIPSKRSVRQFGQSSMASTNLITHAFSGFAVFADVIAVRVMLFALFLAVVIVMLGACAIGLRIFTELPIPGWTSIVLGILAVMLFQLLTTVAVMLMLILSMRSQSPLIPGRDFARFVRDAADPV
jgi:polyisoprenyl-phosphate glycosyltransferase